MDASADLLACPACAGALAEDWSCRGCGARFDAPDGIPDLRLAGDARTETVRRFYERAPFPGYPPRDSLHALRARAERSDFARLLDEAIPGDARSSTSDAEPARCASTWRAPTASSSAPI